MKKLLLALLLLAASPAHAQVGFGGMVPGPGTAHSAGGGGYSGPGDVKSFYWWVGTYAYSAADRGTPAVNVCNASDANCADLSTDATTGLLNVAGTNVGANPCNDSTNICTIKTWYNKGTGGAGYDVTQATIGSRATLLVSCSGISTACGSATNARYQSSSTYTQAQPFSTAQVSYRNSSTSTDVTVMGVSGGWVSGGGFFSANNDAYIDGGTVLQKTSTTDATWHGISANFNSTSSNITVETTSNSGNTGTGSSSGGTINFWKKYDNTRPWQGRIASGGIISANTTTTEQSNINTASQTILGY